jgi:hypothetical protein
MSGIGEMILGIAPFLFYLDVVLTEAMIAPYRCPDRSIWLYFSTWARTISGVTTVPRALLA